MAASDDRGPGTVPVPDPTKLTTEAVDRASAQWDRELAAEIRVITTRLAGMDTAIKLAAERIEQIPETAAAQLEHLRQDIDQQIKSLRDLVNAETSSIAALVHQGARERADQIHAVRELMEALISGNEAEIKTRLAGMDTATELLAANVSKVPLEIVERVGNLRALIDGAIERVQDVTAERFEAVNNRFLERDTRTEQAAQESRISLGAALAAAKEAVSEQNKANTTAIDKAGAATQKQIDALIQLMTTSNKSLEDKIADLKTRLDRGEGGTAGAQEYRTERRLDAGMLVGIAGVVLTIITIAVAIILSGHSAG